MTDLIITEIIRRKKIVNDIKNAAQTWGFFQIVNAGVPLAIMEKMIEGALCFHKQSQEVKEWYSHDSSQNKVHFYSIIVLKPNILGYWRDTLKCHFQEDEANSDSCLKPAEGK